MRQHKHNLLSAIVTCCFIHVVVMGVWLGLEWLFYGETQSRVVDDVISIILTYSLYLNYLHRKENDE